MTLSTATVTNALLRMAHERMIAILDDMDDATLFHSQSRTMPSIAFHVWHTARWADRLQSVMASMTDEMKSRVGERPQIWYSEKLAKAWNLPADKLGGNESGTGMDEDVSVTMPLPARAVLVDYARRAFEAANTVAAAVDDSQMETAAIDLYGRDMSVGSALLNHFGHASRHLGCIEALKGLAGTRGSATI